MGIDSVNRITNATSHLLGPFVKLRRHLTERHPSYPPFYANAGESQQVCAFVAQTLLTLPHHGTDAPPSKRSYYAIPMEFRHEISLFHRLGNLFTADPPLPYAKVARLIGSRTECYKFEVRVPSSLLGFNLDSSKFPWSYHNLEGVLAFEVFDGGQCFDDSTGQLREVAKFEFTVSNDNPLRCRIDLLAFQPCFHDIDRYG